MMKKKRKKNLPVSRGPQGNWHPITVCQGYWMPSVTGGNLCWLVGMEGKSVTVSKITRGIQDSSPSGPESEM